MESRWGGLPSWDHCDCQQPRPAARPAHETHQVQDSVAARVYLGQQAQVAVMNSRVGQLHVLEVDVRECVLGYTSRNITCERRREILPSSFQR